MARRASLEPKIGVFVRFRPDTVKKLDEIAASEESDRSSIIRSIVLKALREEPIKKISVS